MDRKIGEKFEYFDTVTQKTVELVVEETKANNFLCKGCYFAHLKDICNFQCYQRDKKATGECNNTWRNDKKLIIYRLITDEEKKKEQEKARIEIEEAEKKAKKEEKKFNRKLRWLRLKNILLGITEKELLEIERHKWNKYDD